jgi:hypothetical protein
MSPRTQKIVLGVLLVVLVAAYFYGTSSGTGTTSNVSSDVQFTPLNVQQPELRVDLLEKAQKSAYSAGPHRNIFVIGPAPIERTPQEVAQEKANRFVFVGPKPAPPPPPMQVAAQFFGTATMPVSGRHVAFFQSGEDVVVVAEGDAFLVRYRLIHIANESADVMEISSGRHTSVPLVPPVVDQASNQAPGQPNQPQADPPNQDVSQ